MSTFKTQEVYSVPLSSSVLGCLDNFKATFVRAGWQVIGEDRVAGTIDIIPSASEPIGNERGFALCRFTFGSDRLKYQAIPKYTRAIPQVIAIWTDKPGAVAYSVTVAGVTVAAPAGTASSTAKDNLRALYNALRASTNPTIQGWTWEYNPEAPRGSDDQKDYIIGVAKVAAPNVAISATNGLCGTVGNYVPANTLGVAGDPVEVLYDLVYGFVAFFSNSGRSITIGSKTNTDWQNPLHICYADNADARAACPDNPWCTPVELFFGFDDADTTVTARYQTSHWYGTTTRTRTNGEARGYHPASGLSIRGWTFDSANVPGQDLTYAWRQLKPSGVYDYMGSADDASIQQMQIETCIAAGECYAQAYNCGYSCPRWVPRLPLTDWYRYLGTGIQEGTAIAYDSAPSTTLVDAMDATTASATITVSDGSKLKPAGTIVIGQEMVDYTGITGNTLTGCTRAKYVSVKEPHYPGDAVFQGMFFCKIKGTALFLGYTNPMAG